VSFTKDTTQLDPDAAIVMPKSEKTKSLIGLVPKFAMPNLGHTNMIGISPCVAMGINTY
jgi:hypothetical protein